MTLAGLRIARPHNCLGAALATVVGGRLAGANLQQWTDVGVRAALVVGLGVAAVNIANDYVDAGLDGWAKPHRPIPAGDISLRAARTLAAATSVTALALALSLGRAAGLVAGVSILLGILYSIRFKSTVLLGNALVGALSATALLFGGVVGGGVTTRVAFGGLVVFLFIFAREILKTIADHDGDAAAGVNTIATRFGTQPALRVFGGVTILFVIAALAPSIARPAPQTYLWMMLGLAVLPTLAVLSWLYVRPTPTTLHASLRTLKIVLFSGLAAVSMLR